MSNVESAIAANADKLANEHGGFPAQEQEPPGMTGAMRPTPDHGEDTYVGNGRLDGLRTLITGGDSGIGRATAIAFAREGANVALSYLEAEQEDAEETARSVRRAERKAVLLPGDVTGRRASDELNERDVNHQRRPE